MQPLRPRRKHMQYIKRAIRRAVVAGDQFMRQQLLPSQAVQLLLKKPLTVISGHRLNLVIAPFLLP